MGLLGLAFPVPLLHPPLLTMVPMGLLSMAPLLLALAFPASTQVSSLPPFSTPFFSFLSTFASAACFLGACRFSSPPPSPPVLRDGSDGLLDEVPSTLVPAAQAPGPPLHYQVHLFHMRTGCYLIRSLLHSLSPPFTSCCVRRACIFLTVLFLGDAAASYSTTRSTTPPVSGGP